MLSLLSLSRWGRFNSQGEHTLLSEIYSKINTKKSFHSWLKTNGYESDQEVGYDVYAKLLFACKNTEAKEQLATEVLEMHDKMHLIISNPASISLTLPEGWYRHNKQVLVDSRTIAEALNKPHNDFLKSIRKEIEILSNVNAGKFSCVKDSLAFNTPSGSVTLSDACNELLEGFVKSTYTDPKGQARPVFLLDEAAATHMAAKHSSEIRALLVIAFRRHQKSYTQYLESVSLALNSGELRPIPRRVYIMYNARDNIVKIGIAKDPEERLKEFHTVSKDIYCVWQSPPATNAAEIEAEAHRALEDKRVYGEWFAVTPEEAHKLLVSVDYSINF